MSKILVTGAFGQIGSELVPYLEKVDHQSQVISLDLKIPENFKGIAERADVTDYEQLEQLFKQYQPKTVYHLASILSARGEQLPELAWQINVTGLKNILELCVKYHAQLFWPSSIAAFGPTTPRVKTPQLTILEPTTIYGITKALGEQLCHYYFIKYGLDVRSLRYPGLISWKAQPGGGTTDYAVEMFYYAINRQPYSSFVSKDTALPMMYMDDAIKATSELMSAQPEKLTIRTSYNLSAMSFSVGELATEINKHIHLKVAYQPDFRQKIADSWPQSIDDSVARNDWGWHEEYNLTAMTQIMLKHLTDKLNDKSDTKKLARMG